MSGNGPDIGNVWRYEEKNGEKVVTNGEQELKIGEEINYNCTEIEGVGEMPGGENPPEGGNFPTGDRGPEPPGFGQMGEPGKAPPQGEKNGGETDSPLDEEMLKEMLSYTTELGKYTYNATDYKGKWGILGAENGKILITPMENVKNTNKDTEGELYLSGKPGYTKGITELDKISEIYGHGKGADGGRSITVEDIDKLTGYNPSDYGIGEPEQYGNTIEFYWKKGDGYRAELWYRDGVNR